MADSHLVLLQRELQTTERLQLPAPQFQCNRWPQMGWESRNSQTDRRCPWFSKKVMKGSLHHLPQSVICIPTQFMQAHLNTFQPGNLITLRGPSGNTWMVRATGKPILHSGWRAFAHDHNLHEGDEVCFTLTQPLHFVVDVLNRHGDVKEGALTAVNTGTFRVASVCFPYKYVRRPRRRKSGQISGTYHNNVTNGDVPSAATIASRCKTTARERSGGFPNFASFSSFPNMLRFSHKWKLWESRLESDGREIVTILDSDDDGDHDEKRPLDHFELSFGSAQVPSHRMSQIQSLMGYMKQQGEYVPPLPNRAPEEQWTFATQTHPELGFVGHGEKFIPAQNVNPPHPGAAAEVKEEQAQEFTVMWNKEEAERTRPGLVKSEYNFQLQISTPQITASPEKPLLRPRTISTMPLEIELNSVPIFSNFTETILPAVTNSHQVQSPAGECMSAILPSIVEKPVIAEPIITLDPVKEHPTSIRPVSTVAAIYELIKNQEPERKEIIVALNSDKHREFPVHRRPSIPSIPSIPSKTSTTACVLKSKRMQVAKLHRAQALRAAQALTKKLRSPTFVAVMKTTNVYSDFSMDIPADFGKRSRLPLAEVKLTLVCDEVPTMSRAVWIGTNPEHPKLDADAWMEFSRSHFLEEGDVCVFELFNRVTIRLGIHIFRVVALRRSSLPLHWKQHYNVVHLATPTPPPEERRCSSSDTVLISP